MSKSAVAYELAIVGGQVSEDESTRFDQVEELDQIVRRCRGEAVGAWEYHFSTLSDAKEAARGIRQMGLAFDDIQIRTVDGTTGKDLPS